MKDHPQTHLKFALCIHHLFYEKMVSESATVSCGIRFIQVTTYSRYVIKTSQC